MWLRSQSLITGHLIQWPTLVDQLPERLDGLAPPTHGLGPPAATNAQLAEQCAKVIRELMTVCARRTRELMTVYDRLCLADHQISARPGDPA